MRTSRHWPLDLLCFLGLPWLGEEPSKAIKETLTLEIQTPPSHDNNQAPHISNGPRCKVTTAFCSEFIKTN